MLQRSSFNLSDVSGVITQQDILVVKGFADEPLCDAVIAAAHDVDIPRLAKPDWQIANWVSTWQQDSMFDYYRFSDVNALGSDCLLECFDAMRTVIDSIRTSNRHAIKYEAGLRYHLELLHYGHGHYFGRHAHEFDPQCVGLILLLNQAGRDYASGGTVFHDATESVDINDHAGKGDLVIFRYDMQHEVTPVSGTQGRWTAVLPYY